MFYKVRTPVTVWITVSKLIINNGIFRLLSFGLPTQQGELITNGIRNVSVKFLWSVLNSVQCIGDLYDARCSN